MGPVKEEWNVESKPQGERIDMSSIEEWDGDQSIDMPVYHRRHTAGLWTALASLTIALGVVAAYGYSVIGKQNAELNWLHSRLNTFSALRDRTSRLENSLKGLASGQANLTADITKVDALWKSRLNKSRLHLAGLVANTHQSDRTELIQRTTTLKAEIAQLASGQQSDHVRIAELEEMLARARRELASARASYARQLKELQIEQVSSQREIASLNDVLSTDHISFEAKKNHDQEIVRGVLLHLTGTDPGHQRFRGWIRLSGRGRRIWVRSHPIESPVVFYAGTADTAYELVVTQINRDVVAGYLLVPSDTSGQQQDVASNSKSPSNAGAHTF